MAARVSRFGRFQATHTDRIYPLDNASIELGNVTVAGTMTYGASATTTFNGSVDFNGATTLAAVNPPADSTAVVNKGYVDGLAPELTKGQLTVYSVTAGQNAALATAVADDEILISAAAEPSGLLWQAATIPREIPAVFFPVPDAAVPPPLGVIGRVGVASGSVYGIKITSVANEIIPFNFVLPSDYAGGAVSIWLDIIPDASDPGPGITVFAELENTITITEQHTVTVPGTANTFAFVPTGLTGIHADVLEVIRGYSTTLHPAGITMPVSIYSTKVSCSLRRSGAGAGVDDYAGDLWLVGARLRYMSKTLSTTALAY